MCNLMPMRTSGKRFCMLYLCTTYFFPSPLFYILLSRFRDLRASLSYELPQSIPHFRCRTGQS